MPARHDRQHLRDRGLVGSARGRAVLRPAALAILRPEAVEDEAVAFAALLRLARVHGAIARRPGQRDDVIVEAARLRAAAVLVFAAGVRTRCGGKREEKAECDGAERGDLRLARHGDSLWLAAVCERTARMIRAGRRCGN